MTGELIVPNDAPSDLIRAAGGIVSRFVAGGRVEVACIYREARGDWTFPKGKLDEGETFEQGALREVLEETGMRVSVDPLRRARPTTRTARASPRSSPTTSMEVNEGEFAPNEEVDELIWVPLEQVRANLTWDRDQRTLRPGGRRCPNCAPKPPSARAPGRGASIRAAGLVKISSGVPFSTSTPPSR